MKIEYDNSKDYFKMYNISQAIVSSKRAVKRKSKKMIVGYLTTLIIYLMLFIVIRVAGMLTDEGVVIFLGNFGIGIMVFSLVLYAVFYCYESRKSLTGYIEIDEFGITDYSDSKLTVGFGWEKIDFVVIDKDVITILTKYPILILLTPDLKDKLVKGIAKYNKDVLIVDRTK